MVRARTAVRRWSGNLPCRTGPSGRPKTATPAGARDRLLLDGTLRWFGGEPRSRVSRPCSGSSLLLRGYVVCILVAGPRRQALTERGVEALQHQ